MGSASLENRTNSCCEMNNQHNFDKCMTVLFICPQIKHELGHIIHKPDS